MLIRTAAALDLPSIVGIYNQAVLAGFQTGDLEPVSVESRQGWFESHGPETYPLYVAVSDQHVAGWCSLSAYRPGRAAFRHTAEISYYVDSAYRRRGIAAALIKHAVADCARLDFRALFALVLDVNQASQSLIVRQGFEQWGFLPGAAWFGETEVGHLIYGMRLHVGAGTEPNHTS
ncbi:GNAT family N-acetyltransferase [Longimicrobium terrae]|uniref:Phosphinothricin acetyltransferase n=1 Tax=Longimicrobium terrae TaxID=1639882 RepID=A0A841GS89_9BACT|nr:GNAT family N-acetyltransferase [Longimicrobium terrae]MBB4634804.1 phosphinothricin acetyltransferase [Longimicrobium terrae]MBB6069199.1 phosphinothricin acetyltransferase [Longimicrobium terrae]NNC31989.1 N-acetyltransferase [Longimicrobium terrae]